MRNALREDLGSSQVLRRQRQIFPVRNGALVQAFPLAQVIFPPDVEAIGCREPNLMTTVPSLYSKAALVLLEPWSLVTSVTTAVNLTQKAKRNTWKAVRNVRKSSRHFRKASRNSGKLC
jgi:hypothetical protein